MAKVKNQLYRATLGPLFPLIFLSCGPYSFNPGGSGAKSIAVPLFENQTTQFGVREALTDSVSARFLRDNTLKITSTAGAELLLAGAIVRYERTAHAFDANQQVKQYVVNVWAAVSVTNQKDRKIVWEEKELLGFGIYDANLETEEDGKARAVSKLAENIVNRTLRGW
ncbi:MAG: LPS assembly lipoprotein LptE [candidate division Zixibacteria bacterium]|nr:LPS assembly lipoprotein LptE [candidate division Zixibacteria bacterium]